MQAVFSEFFDDISDALREAVRQLGGPKKLGPMLWPELPIEQAGNRLRDCLNADRREKLSPEQVMLIVRLACQAGHHGLMGYIAYQAGYTVPQPLAPDDEAAVLQRAFVEAVSRLDQIQQQLARAQAPRRVA